MMAPPPPSAPHVFVLLFLLLATRAEGFSTHRIWPTTRTIESPTTLALSTFSSSSDSTAATVTASDGRRRLRRQQQLVYSAASVARRLQSKLTLMQTSFDRSLYKFVRRYWWTVPLILCLVPLYSSVVYKTTPETPQWWKLINLEHAAQPEGAHSSFLTLFLCSNASYLIGGLYLLKQYPLLKRRRQGQQPLQQQKRQQSTRVSRRSSSRAALLPLVQPLWLWTWLWTSSSSSGSFKYVPSRGTWLSVWMLLAGLVSTLFHAVQAYGPYAIAEGWCYLDHGIAIAATMYFLEYCKAPERPTLLVGILGMLALTLPTSSSCYLWLHSAWHFLSAGSAVMWASQRRALRRAQLEHSLVRVRSQQQQQQQT